MSQERADGTWVFRNGVRELSSNLGYGTLARIIIALILLLMMLSLFVKGELWIQDDGEKRGGKNNENRNYKNDSYTANKVNIRLLFIPFSG